MILFTSGVKSMAVWDIGVKKAQVLEEENSKLKRIVADLSLDKAMLQASNLKSKPMTIKTDNGSELISNVMDKWVFERGIQLDFSRPGKPTDNAMVESLNGRLRQECLNEHWFMNLQDSRNKIELWPGFFNEKRPRSALERQTPKEFTLKNGSKSCLQNNKEPDLLTSEW